MKKLIIAVLILIIFAPLAAFSSNDTRSKKENRFYATFDNHKSGDFKPYVLKSTDQGKTWKSITGDLPVRGSVYSLVEDHVQPNLLFAGTEFGVFFTLDGGKQWLQLKGGMPIIAVRELIIQKRENDLVAATFGRGFYILDDYTPLRHTTPEVLAETATLFPVKKTWMYIQDSPLGGRNKGSQGDSYFTAPNPPFGAVFTYYLKEGLKTRQKMRSEKTKKIEKEGGIPAYPTWDELRAERREEKPVIILTITDEENNTVRRLTGSTSAGMHRLVWNLRYPASTPTSVRQASAGSSFRRSSNGPMVVPGTYKASLTQQVDGKITPLGTPQNFTIVPLGTATLPAKDRQALLVFQKKTAKLQRAVLGAGRAASEAQNRINLIKRAIFDTPNASPELMNRTRDIELRLKDLQIKLTGDPVIRAHNEPRPPSITSRVQGIVSGHWSSTSAPTQTHLDAYEIAADEFTTALKQLRILVEQDLKNLEQELENIGAPYTPGRVPIWTRE